LALKKKILNIGDLFVTEESMIIETVLGSCVSVTMYDNKNKIGGMNHIMLPGTFNENDIEMMLKEKDEKYGVFSIEKLLYRMEYLGSKRQDIEAKIFGASYLGNKKSVLNIQEDNVEFVKAFLSMARIKVIEEVILQEEALKITFNTSNGKVKVTKLKKK